MAKGRQMSKLMWLSSCLTFLAAIIIILAFSTPYWLIADGRQPGEQRFERLGLWEACFHSFHDVYYRYDIEFKGCRWIFDEEYNIIIEILEPPFFIAVQVFFTFGFIALLLACALLLALQICFPSEKEVLAMKLLSLLMLIAGICCTIALITFGARGDGRDWMPDPDHNYLSWSFGLGVVGAFLEYVVSVLFLVESRLAKKRLAIREQQNYNLEQNQNKMGTVI
ncbi:uncharacterized protein LOC106473481 isoform X1 [Limulus polyphemus]|uniref:Uncharacterized protein LOC106473481 isoform X1 n=1 Tax=Limulus polyphemus TaxID=6850 RepID=A0ABM1TP07_LIMPO|nr:uncharacterized protein LOC106473481 isoform X1 [Limulus polyphemus]